MKFKLYRIEMYGIKNIKDLISIDFYPQTIDNSKKKNISRVKAIYGNNGLGKTAIINGISLYKKIILDNSFLLQNTEITKLNKLINKIKKEFYICCIYGFKFNPSNKYSICKNEIKIKLVDGIPLIEFEKLSILKDQTINGNYSLLYEVNDGKLNIYNTNNSEVNDFIYNKTMNILKNSSLSSTLKTPDISNYFREYANNHKIENINKSGILKDLVINTAFVSDISIYLDSIDIHTEYDIELIDKFLDTHFTDNEKALYRNTIGAKRDMVIKNRFNEYKKNINKLTSFIKIFKPDLKEIAIDTVETPYYYLCSKKMIYPDYEVDSDYESAGIQKLMSMFNLLDDVCKEKIVFIDELDANINGVYLKVLIEYLNDLNKGQLCFTTHNLSPMHYLYKYTYAIDFLGETGKLVPWKKNGNYKPYNLYPEGLIVDSPFNIDAIDFIKVFEGTDNN